MKRSVLALLLALACPLTAGAANGSTTFSASGTVLVPTFGNPIAFGFFHACDPDHALQGIGGYSIRLPADAPGHAFTLKGTPAVDVVWLDGPQGMSCTGNGYEARDKGTVPARTDWAFVVLPSGRNASFTLEITGLS